MRFGHLIEMDLYFPHRTIFVAFIFLVHFPPPYVLCKPFSFCDPRQSISWWITTWCLSSSLHTPPMSKSPSL